ncbi:sunset domain-containing protein [Nakamurella lactea]|uniref:sunset domain-containing protein n=1 Tax=Nakamurella lactea TaxID=459515 RepID=UPI0003FA4332|nr:hypothetical protein [Nakamurella lactea]
MSADLPQSPYNFDRPAAPPKRKRPWLGAGLVATGTLVVGLVIGNAAGGGTAPTDTAAGAGSTVTVSAQPKALAAVTVTQKAKAATPKTKTVEVASTVLREQTVRVPTTVAVTHQVTKTLSVDRTVQQVVKVTVTAEGTAAQQAEAPQQVADGGPVPPSGGSCPAEAPIKGNADSMIYHVPGGEFYDRTNPEECFATEADAVAAGYRASKR